MKQRLLLLLFSALLLPACGSEDLRVYTIPKEQHTTPPLAAGSPHSSTGGEHSAGAHLHWDNPPGWQSQAPTGMRLASYQVPAANGRTADMSIIRLPGPAGGLLANINRWREQMKQGPWTQDDLEKLSEKLESPAGKLILVDFKSGEKLLDGRYYKRTLGAVLVQGDQTWFFKMTGEDQAVGQSRNAFLQLLKSLRNHG